MSRIARAASSSVVSRPTTSSCGSSRWSMISIVRPSAAGQIVRIGRPLTFIASSLEDAAGDRIESRDERRIARRGRGDQRMVESMLATLAAWAFMAREQRHDGLDERLGLLGIGDQHLYDLVYGHRIVPRVPAIVIGDHRH